MFSDLMKTQRPLMFFGFVSALAFAILTVFALVDPTEITGLNRWIKPMKFAISIAIFVWTLAVYLNFLEGHKRIIRFISFATIFIFAGEMSLIIIQAARGVRSHFNISTAFDGAVFAAMGVLIFLNTLITCYVLYLYFAPAVAVSRPVLWGMRFGLILLIAASIEGGYMSQALSHSVGVADGGRGLPILNWSTEGGDLRIAHFVGLHAFQTVPLFALAVERLGFKKPLLLTTTFAALYFFAFTVVFVWALLGRSI